MGNKNVTFTASILALIQLSYWLCVVAQHEQCNSNSRSNYGKTFFLATMVNFDRRDPVTFKIVSNTTGFVHIVAPIIGLNQTYSILPPIAEIVINSSVRSNTTGIGNKGIMLKSTVDVAIFVFEPTLPDQGLGEGYMLIPIDESSTSYVVQSYEPASSDSKSQFVIVATEDSSNINISLKMNTSLIYLQKQYVNGDFIYLKINRMQTFHLYHGHDISGSIIESDKPVAVFSGGDCVRIPLGIGYCDIIETQLVPVEHWDYNHIVPPIYPTTRHLVRISAFYNNTKVILTGSSNLSNILNKGNVWDIFLDGEPAVISSDKRSNVALICISDRSQYDSSFMLTSPGVSQMSPSPYVFSTMTNGNSHPYNNYVSIVLKRQFKNQLMYNGSLLAIIQEYTVPPPFDQYVVVVAKLKDETTHIISTYNTSTPMCVFVYGLGYYEAYGFVAGIHLNHTDCAASTAVSAEVTTTSMASTNAQVLTTPAIRTFSRTVTIIPTTALTDTQPSMQCFSCVNIEHLRYCDTIQHCQENEVCFVSSHRAVDGDVFYSSGCTDQQSCGSSPHRRSSVHNTCFQCCHSEFCNAGGCNEDGFPPVDQRGPLCYDCDQFSHPLKCHHVALCGKNEQCSIEEFRWGGTELVYKMGCMATSSCPHEAEDEHLKQSRSSPLCRTCCSSDFCNVNCTHLHFTAQIIG